MISHGGEFFQYFQNRLILEVQETLHEITSQEKSAQNELPVRSFPDMTAMSLMNINLRKTYYQIGNCWVLKRVVTCGFCPGANFV